MAVGSHPSAMERDLRLDFFRGLALFCIFLDHLPNNILAQFTLQSVMFADAVRRERTTAVHLDVELTENAATRRVAARVSADDNLLRTFLPDETAERDEVTGRRRRRDRSSAHRGS